MRTIASFIALLAVLLTTAAAAPPATAAGCTTAAGTSGNYVWVKSPTTIDGLSKGKTSAAGTRLCRSADQWVNEHFVESRNGWVRVTKRVPNSGGPAGSPGRAHADAAKALAKKYGVVLQFAEADEVGRVGYVTKSKVLLTGNYTPGGERAPGQGLIRIGNGGDNMSVAGSGNNWFRKRLLETVRHEIAHSEIEQRCGTTRPPVAGGNAVRKSTGKPIYEHVTEAYAALYLGASPEIRPGYGYSKAWDVPRAKAIRAGNCG